MQAIGFGDQAEADANCSRFWREHRHWQSSHAPSVVEVGPVHCLQLQVPRPSRRLGDGYLGYAHLLESDLRYQVDT